MNIWKWSERKASVDKKRLEQGGADRQEPQKGQELKPPVLISNHNPAQMQIKKTQETRTSLGLLQLLRLHPPGTVDGAWGVQVFQSISESVRNTAFVPGKQFFLW